MIRFFDLVLSLSAILILSPVFVPIVIVLKFIGEGYVFYRQPRVGYNGKIFFVLKFATMLKDSPNIGTGTITKMNDPRVLKFGRYLRATKVNELPQLFNVLIGQMSLIGPSPLTAETFGMYSTDAQGVISQLKPGLSGVGSVFFRSEEKYTMDAVDVVSRYKEVIAPYKAELEIWYFENYNLTNYLKLILCTLIVVFTKHPGVLSKVFNSLPKPNSFISERMYN